MNDYLINPLWYRPLFLHVAVLVSLMQANKAATDQLQAYNTKKDRKIIWLLAIFFSLFIGLRPTHITFGDDYELFYDHIDSLEVGKDWLFSYLAYFCKINGLSWHVFSVLIDSLYYCGTAYAVCKIFQNRTLTAFAVVIAAFSFFSYSTNGLRNGLACSMFFIALAYYKERKWFPTAFFCVLALGFHNSLMVPLAAAALCNYYQDTKKYIYFWVGCIGISLVVGDMMETLLTNMGFLDTGRDISYFSNEINGGELATRDFRWDFLIYSAVPIFVGYHFVIRKSYSDKYYKLMLNIYILVNSVWVLVNQNWLSNRMAFLSWFMYALVLMYPILNIEYLRNRSKWIFYSVAGNAAFSYLMWILGKYR